MIPVQNREILFIEQLQRNIKGFNRGQTSLRIRTDFTPPRVRRLDAGRQGATQGLARQTAFQLRQQAPGAIQQEQWLCTIATREHRPLQTEQQAPSRIKSETLNRLMKLKTRPSLQSGQSTLGNPLSHMADNDNRVLGLTGHSCKLEPS